MRRLFKEEILLSGVVLLLAGVAPNIFPAAQAGVAKMSVLAVQVLIPSIVLLIAVFGIAKWRHHRRLVNRVLMGAAGGLIATLGLEVVRIISFHGFAGMPGDMPRLIGVLLTDRFMFGPSTLSDILGWSYHFWNGACFGIISAVILGRPSMFVSLIFAQLIGIGFLLSPAVKALGIGFMGTEMPSMPITVILAHLAYGVLLGLFFRRRIKERGWLFGIRQEPDASPTPVIELDH